MKPDVAKPGLGDGPSERVLGVVRAVDADDDSAAAGPADAGAGVRIVRGAHAAIVAAPRQRRIGASRGRSCGKPALRRTVRRS
jgi:hypothetical protein